MPVAERNRVDMADFKIAYNYTLVDADGNLGKVVIHSVVGDAALVSQSVTDLNALGTPLAALTNAKVAGTSYTVQVDAAQGLGTDAPYAGIEDKARLSFRNAFGSKDRKSTRLNSSHANISYA